jgi:hypothetical protein
MGSVKFAGGAVGFVCALAFASCASAGTIPYQNVGTENPVTYTLTAATSGDIVAYFAGSAASYDEEVTLSINGVATGVYGLDNQTSAVGTTVDFGYATAGSTLVFYDDVLTTGDVWSSDVSENSDGANHIYSTYVTAGEVYPGSPAGVYVAFEDLPASTSDFNYFDDTFIFTNVAVTSAVPEPSTWAMFVVGFAGLGAAAFSRTRKTRAASAA